MGHKRQVVLSIWADTVPAPEGEKKLCSPNRQPRCTQMTSPVFAIDMSSQTSMAHLGTTSQERKEDGEWLGDDSLLPSSNTHTHTHIHSPMARPPFSPGRGRRRSRPQRWQESELTSHPPGAELTSSGRSSAHPHGWWTPSVGFLARVPGLSGATWHFPSCYEMGIWL